MYFYGPDGRGPCFIIDSIKTSLTWFRNYLVIVSKPPRKRILTASSTTDTPSGSSLSDSILLGTSTSSSDHEYNSLHSAHGGTVLTLYDLKNKFVAFSGTFGGMEGDKRAADSSNTSAVVAVGAVAIKSVVSEWGELLVTTADRRMWRLEEKDVSFYSRFLFTNTTRTYFVVIYSSTRKKIYSFQQNWIYYLQRICTPSRLVLQPLPVLHHHPPLCLTTPFPVSLNRNNNHSSNRS